MSQDGPDQSGGDTPPLRDTTPVDVVRSVAARPRHRRSIHLLAVSAVALVGAAVALPLLAGSGPSASAAVLAAVDSTLGQRTSDIAMHVAVTVDGHSTTLSGTGQVDYASHAMALDVALPGSAGSLQELVVGTTFYEQTPGISAVAPGKSWVSLDLASLRNGAAGGSPTSAWSATANPLAVLPLIEKEGGTVLALGPGTVGDRSVQGYRVTFDHTALAAQVAKLPADLRPMASLLDLGGLTLQLEVTGTGLLAQTTMTMSGSLSRHAFTGDVTMDFSTFGTSVDVSAPPSTQVVTLQQFLGDAAGAQQLH